MLFQVNYRYLTCRFFNEALTAYIMSTGRNNSTKMTQMNKYPLHISFGYFKISHSTHFLQLGNITVSTTKSKKCKKCLNDS